MRGPPTEEPPQRACYPHCEPDKSQMVRLQLMLSIWFRVRESSVVFPSKVIWSAYGHRSSYNEGLHTLRRIQRGVSSHWHYNDTRFVSRGRFSFRKLGTNADPHPYHSLLFLGLGLLAVSNWLLTVLPN